MACICYNICAIICKTNIFDYINSIFWAVKDKSEKLNKLSLSIHPNDLPDSIIEGKVNDIMIKGTKKLIE